MSHRARRITDAIRSHDQLLYAKKDGSMIKIFRKCKELRSEKLTVDHDVLVVFRNDWLVMALTDSWTIRGNPVDWGIEPIMARLKAMDLWHSGNLADEAFEQNEKEEKSKERAFRNNVEGYLSEFKSAFAKATDDVVTGNMKSTFKGV